MHSRRMRTVRSSSRLLGGGCLPPGGGVCPSWGVYPGDVYPGGCLPGGCVSQHALRQTPPCTKFLTHACENITFPQLRLPTVISITSLGRTPPPHKNCTFCTILHQDLFRNILPRIHSVDHQKESNISSSR